MAITTLGLTGFEHGFIGAGAQNGGGLFDAAPGSGWSASTSSPRNGNYCAHLVAPANTATKLVNNVTGSPTKIVVRFAVKVSSRPTGTGVISVLANFNNGNLGNFQVTETGALRANLFGGVGVVGSVIATTDWHLIELQLDTAAKTLDWKVDGVAQTRATTGNALAAVTTFELGTWSTTSPAFTADFDDVIVGTWTNAVDDWYGDGKVLAQRAGVDGTHATITSLSPGDAGTAYSGTPTTVNTMVDDPPGTLGWTTTRSTTDNIALRTATVGAYAEIKPATTAETEQANAVKAIVSYSSPATQANLAACDVRNSAGTVTPLWGTTGGTGADYSETANQFKSAIVTRPAAGWTAAEVNAIRFRFGGCTSVDISPVPTVQAMMLEVDWPIIVPVVPTAYDLVIDSDSPTSHWKLNKTTIAKDRKLVQDLPALNGPIATAPGLLVANNDSDLANTFNDASQQKFEVGANSTVGAPYNTPQWSAECWVKIASTPARNVLNRHGSQQGIYFLNGPTSCAQMTQNSPQVVKQAMGPVLTWNVTYYLVATYDGTNLILYVNGVEAARTPSTAMLTDLFTAPTIGGGQVGGYMAGDIDEPAWYNFALSPARVLAHYQAGGGVVPSANKLVSVA